MKVSLYTIRGVSLLIGLSIPLIALADPFFGESKADYKNRCVEKSDMPGLSIKEKKEFCSCFADKLEAGYQNMLKSIESTDSIISAQKKMDKVVMKSANSFI